MKGSDFLPSLPTGHRDTDKTTNCRPATRPVCYPNMALIDGKLKFLLAKSPFVADELVSHVSLLLWTCSQYSLETV